MNKERKKITARLREKKNELLLKLNTSKNRRKFDKVSLNS
jgi:hypothetical protein